MPAWLESAITWLVLAACVLAVVLARRGARRKWQQAFDLGAASVASARSSAGVVLGDVTYVRGDGIAAHHGTATRDDDDDASADASVVALRVAAHGHGMGELRDGSGRHVDVRRAVVARPPGGRAAGALRAARPSHSDVTT